MLPVLKAISYIPQTLKGGTTQPILVEVLVGHKIVPYVVKVFTTETLNQYSAVFYEVFSNKLAQQFDLKVPEAALIEFDKDFMRNLPKDVKAELFKRDGRIKFGSRFISPTFPYSKALGNKYFKKFELETVYGFDCMVFNGDRKEFKPNMLFNAKNAILIDHEHCLWVNQTRIDKIKEGRLVYPFKNHLFYHKLKRQRNKPTFETFEYYLSILNTSVLDSYHKQLLTHGHEINNYDLIIEYLCYVKNNPTQYTKVLISTIK